MDVRLAAIVVALVLPLSAQEAPRQSRPSSPSSAALLARAAHANDFAAFDTQYRATPVPAFRALHELWTYSVTEPGGAFYGVDMYQRFTRAYPAFAAAIGPHRIVD